MPHIFILNTLYIEGIWDISLYTLKSQARPWAKNNNLSKAFIYWLIKETYNEAPNSMKSKSNTTKQVGKWFKV